MVDAAAGGAGDSMNATAIVCDSCLSRALVLCLICGRVCCLSCELTGEQCDCGHSESHHRLTRTEREHLKNEALNE